MFESTVRVIPRVIKEQLKIAIPECAAGGVKIEDLDGSSLDRGGLVLIGVEFEDVVTVAVFARLDLLEEIFVAEDPKVAPHCFPYCSIP